MSDSFNPQPGGPPKNLYHGNATFTTANAGFDPATFDQRAIAWTIDTLLLLAVQKGFESFSPSAGSLASLFTVIYFIVGHYFFECTAGKYFVGLRVHLVGDESRKFGKILFRETIGRFVSIIFLGFGYLAMLFSQDRATWHDRLSGTQVVSLNPVTSSTFAMVLRGVASLALFVVVLVGYLLGTMLYSSAPLEALETRLALAGVHITGIRGNMMNGYEIDKLTYEKDKNFVELNTIRLKIDPWANLQGAKQFKLKHLTVESGLIRVASLGGKKEDKKEEKKAEATSDKKKKSENLSILVEQVDINSIVFEGMDQRFELSRFFISNIKFSTAPVSFVMERFYVDSPQFSLDVPQFEYFNEVVTMPKPLFGKVKMAGLPDKLKMDLTFSARFWGEGKAKSFEANLFNSQLKLGKQGDSYSFNVKQWSPSNYFKGHFPISQITLQMQGDDLLKSELSGDYFLRNKKFSVPKQKAMMAMMAMAGQEVPTVATAKPVMILLSPASFREGGPAWLKIADSVGKTESDSLALLYFQKGLEQLTATEKAVVDADMAFFTSPLWPNRFKDKISGSRETK